MQLLAALLHAEAPLTAAMIQARIDGYPQQQAAFRRAFERDKKDLRHLGVPIEMRTRETVDGSIDSYVVSAEDYYLHNLGLDRDETVALAMALRLIRLEGTDTNDALWKLGGTTTDQSDEQVPAELGAIAMGPLVNTFHQAIAGSVRVEFGYRGDERRLEPWRLEFRQGNWYATGWDLDRDDERRFRLDRIEGAVEITTDPATAPRSRGGRADQQPWQFATEDNTVTATVAIDAQHAAWARHHLGTEAVTETRADGSIVVQLEVANRVGFRSFVLSFLDGAQVLDPPELRQELVGWLNEMVKG